MSVRFLGIVAFTALSACSGDDSGGAADGECGDIDGDGTDTGDLPNILGSWTTQFGQQIDFENCSIPGLKPYDMDWINGAAIEIDGRPPDQLYAEFADNPDERFFGALSVTGGIVFAGEHQFSADEADYLLRVSFGGLLYENPLTGRDEMKGHAFFGVDSNSDGYIDCGLQGDFDAYKSGD